MYGYAPMPVNFTSVVGGGKPGYSYRWDFTDGSYASEANPAHTFARAGVYAVSLLVRDSIGNTAYAQVAVEVVDNPDRDNDGVSNDQDLCPDVYGSARYHGCPRVDEYSGASINDQLGGVSATNQSGAPVTNQCLAHKVAITGAIEGHSACASCPCGCSVDFVSQIRSCDIIFPTILSPDKQTIYSRGSVFQTQ